MTVPDNELIDQFIREQSQDAFTALVDRHLNLVYSAALRQVRSPELAEEVAQTVFTHLARHASNVKPGAHLTAWLYTTTRHAAIDAIRRESRRQAREQIASQMSALNESPTDWSHIEPLLDEAMQSLDEADRTALLLRFFENKSLREVGEVLGATEDAAQKRVSRAIERLRGQLSRKQVTVGTSALAALLSANAVQSAPAGLAATVASSVVLASSSLSATATVTHAIIMTTAQKTVLAVLAAGALVTGLYGAREITILRAKVETLQAAGQEQIVLSNQVRHLAQERDEATNALAALVQKQSTQQKGPNEVLKLRGEVGRLKQENQQIGSTNALSKVTANPASRKMLRDQQKMGMGMIYGSLSKKINLDDEKKDQFNDMLADYIMENVGHVTTALRDKMNLSQVDQMLASEDAALAQKLEPLLGKDGLTEYQNYTRDLLVNLTTEQFKGMLDGDEAGRAEKARQLQQLLQEGTRAKLKEAGLPEDYQAVPILNFRNIVFQDEGERSIKMLEDIYDYAATRGGSFLSPAELKKWQEFKATAANNSRTALTINRTIMEPISN